MKAVLFAIYHFFVVYEIKNGIWYMGVNLNFFLSEVVSISQKNRNATKGGTFEKRSKLVKFQK